MTASTTALHPRIDLLLGIIRTQGGEWTPARVRAAYLSHGYAAPQRTTGTADLHLLWQAGYLDRHDTDGRRWYTPRRSR